MFIMPTVGRKVNSNLIPSILGKLSENQPANDVLQRKSKSYGEMDIANFLFQNGIRYEYERPYEKRYPYARAFTISSGFLSSGLPFIY